MQRNTVQNDSLRKSRCAATEIALGRCGLDALGAFWGCCRNALGALWWHSGHAVDTLGAFWGCSGKILGMLWGRFRDVLGPLYKALAMVWGVLGTFWDARKTAWGRSGDTPQWFLLGLFFNCLDLNYCKCI